MWSRWTWSSGDSLRCSHLKKPNKNTLILWKSTLPLEHIVDSMVSICSCVCVCVCVCVREQEMKTLDKEVRAWNVYAGLESTVKNMLTSLRAVNELQNLAVRERHWQQLMNTTGVRGRQGGTSNVTPRQRGI